MRIRGTAFTLIELLIVVAIIAILAAIAVPNFMEAQVRAKVSRARGDLRTIALAVESYSVDNSGAYPLNDGVYNVVPIRLTTPIAYLFSTRMIDPFSERETHPIYGELARFYTYQKVVGQEEFEQDVALGFSPPVEAVDNPMYNPGALRKYGRWRLVSNGPDKKYADPEAFAVIDPRLKGSDIPYDPTNGTISWGNIIRTQRSVDGVGR
ncbi:MAG: prepilin-type N-terminal cleavage/methylation domain-containing protein [Candidatus Sumerlaeia bacterium]